MAIRRKKSTEDILNQMVRLEMALDNQRFERHRQGNYGDERDNTLRNRINRVLNKGREYVNNIHERQGYGKNSWDNGVVIMPEDSKKKYSRASYITAG